MYFLFRQIIFRRRSFVSAIQELESYIKKYPYKIKAARVAKGLTQKELAEKAGVPLSFITKMNVNNQDALLNFAAICRVLGISMDELFGIKGSTDVAELTEQIHELELENVQQAGDVRRLTEVNVEKDKRLYSHRPMLYALIAMCVILTMALIGYMIFDASVTTAGLFKSARTSTFAILFIIVVLLSLVVISLAVKSDLSWNRKEK
nr:MAG TPA: putative transcriptional regulator [Caudoviricetes sp.]